MYDMYPATLPGKLPPHVVAKNNLTITVEESCFCNSHRRTSWDSISSTAGAFNIATRLGTAFPLKVIKKMTVPKSRNWC